MVVHSCWRPLAGLQQLCWLRWTRGWSARAGSAGSIGAQWIVVRLLRPQSAQEIQGVKLQAPRVGPGEVRLGLGRIALGPEPAPGAAANESQQKCRAAIRPTVAQRADGIPPREGIRCSGRCGCHPDSRGKYGLRRKNFARNQPVERGEWATLGPVSGPPIGFDPRHEVPAGNCDPVQNSIAGCPHWAKSKKSDQGVRADLIGSTISHALW